MGPEPTQLRVSAFAHGLVVILTSRVVAFEGLANMRHMWTLEMFSLTQTPKVSRLKSVASLELEPGDVLMMRGDTIHTGFGYPSLTWLHRA